MHEKTAAELAELIRNKEVKPSEVCEFYLSQSNNSLAYLDADRAMDQARALDGEPAISPIFGLPIAIKDNISTSDMPTTCGSKMLSNYTSPFDATVVERIKSAKGIIMGKVKMKEFGESVTSDGIAPLVLADTARGSVVYKPTYGAVSRYGVVSSDRVGIIARTVADAALFAGVISGYDPRDARSNPSYAPDFGLSEPTEDLAEIKAIKAGSFEVPYYCHTAYAVISLAEKSSNLARYDGMRYGYRSENFNDLDELYINSRMEGFTRETIKQILLGTYMLTGDNIDKYYKKARMAQEKIKTDIASAFREYDVLLADPILADITGYPRVILPNGRCIIGKPYEDPKLLNLARAYEKEAVS